MTELIFMTLDWLTKQFATTNKYQKNKLINDLLIQQKTHQMLTKDTSFILKANKKKNHSMI